jgi:DNA invertase Pin-like site-specific DNA recombinase
VAAVVVELMLCQQPRPDGVNFKEEPYGSAADRLRPRLNRPAGPQLQRDALSLLGVSSDRIYVDHGLSGTNRQRPGLRETLAACRAGDTLVVTKLDRLARSLPDARDISQTSRAAT